MAMNASAQLHAIAAALRARGEKGMKREMTAALCAGAQPLVSAVRTSARARLPRSGGLAERVASERITVSVRTASARTAGVALRTRTHDSQATNAGYVRHPVFAQRAEGPVAPGRTRVRGSKDVWVLQEIPQAAGWWTDPLRAGSPAVTPLLLGVMEKVSAEIQAAGGL